MVSPAQLQSSTFSAGLSGKRPPVGKMPDPPEPTITVRTNSSPSGCEAETATLFQVETYILPFDDAEPLLPLVAVRLNAIPPANRWLDMSQSRIGSPELVSPASTIVDETLLVSPG